MSRTLRKPGLADFLPLLHVLLVAAVCVGAVRAARAADVMAHASDQMLWVVEIESVRVGGTSVVRTTGRMRLLGGDATWCALPALTGRAISVANRSDSLAVVMENGDWYLMWVGGSQSGPPLPPGFQLRQVASSSDRFIGLAERVSATTQSSTRNLATTLPTTEVSLWELSGGKWKPILAEGLEALDPAARVNLGLINGVPWIAVQGAGTMVDCFDLADGRTWKSAGSVGEVPETGQFKLVPGSGRMVLWFCGAADAGKLCRQLESGEWSAPQTLETSAKIGVRAAERSLTFAGGNFRLLFSDSGKISEQVFKPDGAASGPPAPLSTPVAPPPTATPSLPTVLIMSLLALLTISAMRKRSLDAPVLLEAAGLQVAPLGPRLAAGVIDLLPVLGTVGYFAWKFRGTTADTIDGTMVIAVLISGAVYLLHTTIVETITTRTVGKMFVGLRVVNIDGTRPSISSLLLRNVLRIIDVFPYFPLVVMVLFSPTAQRLGDIAAGTVVVSRLKP